MNMVETVTVMRTTVGACRNRRFSDPARSQACPQTETGVRRGLVITMLTHDGMFSLSLWSRARYWEGVSPTISLNRELNEPSDVQPTVTHASVTDIPWRSRALAR